MSTIRSLQVCIALVLCSCAVAWAQQYPSKPVRVIIIFRRAARPTSSGGHREE